MKVNHFRSPSINCLLSEPSRSTHINFPSTFTNNGSETKQEKTRNLRHKAQQLQKLLKESIQQNSYLLQLNKSLKKKLAFVNQDIDKFSFNLDGNHLEFNKQENQPKQKKQQITQIDMLKQEKSQLLLTLRKNLKNSNKKNRSYEQKSLSITNRDYYQLMTIQPSQINFKNLKKSILNNPKLKIEKLNASNLSKDSSIKIIQNTYQKINQEKTRLRKQQKKNNVKINKLVISQSIDRMWQKANPNLYSPKNSLNFDTSIIKRQQRSYLDKFQPINFSQY